MTKEQIESISRIWTETKSPDGPEVTRQWSANQRDALVALALRAIDEQAERDRKFGAAVRETGVTADHVATLIYELGGNDAHPAAKMLHAVFRILRSESAR